MGHYSGEEKIKFMERIRSCVPVNKQAAMGMAHHSDGSVDPLVFLSRRVKVVVPPKCVKHPQGIDFSGRRNGFVVVVGYVDLSEMQRLGWWKGRWAVRCTLCGQYENRTPRQISKPSKKEYVDACTQCKSLWAEMVKKEFKKTGRWPPGGGPTFKASHLDENANH